MRGEPSAAMVERLKQTVRHLRVVLSHVRPKIGQVILSPGGAAYPGHRSRPRYLAANPRPLAPPAVGFRLDRIPILEAARTAGEPLLQQ